jgi:hypothetical protein
MRIRMILPALLALCALGRPDHAVASGWVQVAAPPSISTNYSYVTMLLLLSDASVMAQVNHGSNWFRLVPDSSGHYVNGRWQTNVAPMNYTRTFFASDVLPDGRVFVAGGEYGTGKDYTEIYDPVQNFWTEYGAASFGGFADADSVVLSDGQVLLEPQAASGSYGKDTFIFNPATGGYSLPVSPAHDLHESTWVKLANNDILTVDSDGSSYGAFTSEAFSQTSNAWFSTGSVPVSIWADLPLAGVVAETGPALLMANGNAIFFGGSGLTAIYDPTTNGWTQGPDIPQGVCGDAPGAMMNNGKILLVTQNIVDTTNTNANLWQGPLYYYEYDPNMGSTGGFTPLLAPGSTSSFTNGGVCYDAVMLALPDGNILYADDTSSAYLYVFEPDSGPLAAGRPTIYGVTWNSDGSLLISGTLFNGISQGASYGDDAQMDSNYPLARFTDGNGNVSYGRTFNWSSTSVQTGGQVVTTQCTVPANIYDGPGNYTLQVVANGNASAGVTFYGPVWVDFNYSPNLPQLGTYSNPYSTLSQGVSAVVTGGTILLKPGSSSQTLAITKAMTITAIGGSATVGK